MVVSNLKKQYKGRREGFSLSKKRKLATKNVSFCVRKGTLSLAAFSYAAWFPTGRLHPQSESYPAVSSGEVLGLLGPNGAGKSTIMHMLAGDTDPTAGQVQ